MKFKNPGAGRVDLHIDLAHIFELQFCDGTAIVKPELSVFSLCSNRMGLLSLPGYALYSGTKAAVRGFADAYRYELDKGQHFQVIYPVATKTTFFGRAGNNTPVPWPTREAETVAKRVIKGIRKDKDHIFPSTMFRITNAVSRVFPFVFKIYVNINNKAFRKWLAGEKQ